MAAGRFRGPKATRKSRKGLVNKPRKAQAAIRKELRRKKAEGQ